MRLIKLSSAVILLVLISCTSTQVVGQKYITSSPVLLAYEDYLFSMKEQRLPVEFNDGVQVENCNEYILLKSETVLVETESNFLASQNYVMCETLSIIKKSEDFQKISLLPIKIGEALAKQIDLRSFRSSLFKRANENAYTLDAISKGALEISDYGVVLESDNWFFELQVVARIDANSDGVEDWLIWVSDRAKMGSYNTFKGYIAYGVEDEIGLSLNKL